MRRARESNEYKCKSFRYDSRAYVNDHFTRVCLRTSGERS